MRLNRRDAYHAKPVVFDRFTFKFQAGGAGKNCARQPENRS